MQVCMGEFQRCNDFLKGKDSGKVFTFHLLRIFSKNVSTAIESFLKLFSLCLIHQQWETLNGNSI